MKDEDARLPKPPTEAEEAFDRFLDRFAEDPALNVEAFIAARPAAVRTELRRMIDDYQALRDRFGDAPSLELKEGARFGGYTILRELGRGGMGVVYEAQDPKGRSVALKVLTEDLAFSDEAFQRFEREARLAAAISHPRCVFIYGVTEEEGRPAIAMELMSGATLEDEMGAGPVPVEQAVDWMLQVVDGLDAAYRAGVVHRDVKPSNCFLAADGGVKIGDFGISRTLETDTHLTSTGQFLGSPHFASPEQVRGQDVDLRTDVYSVGATLYTLLAGAPPYPGKGLGEVLAHILGDPVPDVRDARSDVPRGLARAIQRAMSKDRDRRFPDYRALYEELYPFSTKGREEERSADGREKLGRLLQSGPLRRFYQVLDWLFGSGKDRSGILDNNYRRPTDAPARIGEFNVVGEIKATAGGKWLLGYDPVLDREVWILWRLTSFPPAPVLRRPTRLRCFGEGVQDTHRYQVFEAPGGAPLSSYRARYLKRPPFRAVHEALISLTDELESDHAPSSADQVWLDRNGNLRVVDPPLGDEPEPTSALDILQETTSSLVYGRYPEKGAAGVPLWADPVLERLTAPGTTFRSVAAARTALVSLRGKRYELSLPQRVLPAAVQFVLAVLISIVVTVEGIRGEELEGLSLRITQTYVFVAAACIALAFLLRGSTWCYLSGIGIRSATGKRAPRLTCAVRATYTWVVVFYWSNTLPSERDDWLEMIPASLLCLFFISLTAGAFLPAGNPPTTHADGLCKTHLVPS